MGGPVSSFYLVHPKKRKRNVIVIITTAKQERKKLVSSSRSLFPPLSIADSNAEEKTYNIISMLSCFDGGCPQHRQSQSKKPKKKKSIPEIRGGIRMKRLPNCILFPYDSVAPILMHPYTNIESPTTT